MFLVLGFKLTNVNNPVYYTEVWQRVGIMEQQRFKSRRIEAERVIHVDSGYFPLAGT